MINPSPHCFVLLAPTNAMIERAAGEKRDSSDSENSERDSTREF